MILGDGNHRPHCEALSKRLGHADRVTSKGFVPQEELKACYRERRVVALSSLWPEPIATIGLEVMRYAVAVVAFHAGWIKDWLVDGHNGFLVPWKDRRGTRSGWSNCSRTSRWRRHSARRACGW
ncbi:MAG: glycosyltransferase [Verrucomicrobiota bacterium]